ncbi:unnamed protein product [Blepharisma stoltei]|uniref:Reverse transcriptase domain-containing protein n=1 Tax=Blepharisma stoltei TaxID=1481888 RepID=A0AAU9J597_9CILI|nr:unnamed protein product [Blepharisma stoltei]
MMIQLWSQKVNVPVGPVGRNGDINFLRYLMQVTLPIEIGIGDVLEALESRCRVVEVVIDNIMRDENTWYAVHFNPNSRYRIYGEFAKLEDAIDLPEEIVIKGRRIFINHAASLLCGICKQIGHNDEGHKRMEMQREERIRVDGIRRKKKEEERRVRVKAIGENLGLRMKLEDDKHNNSTYAGLIKAEEAKTEATKEQIDGRTSGLAKRTPQEAGLVDPPMKRAKIRKNRTMAIAHLNIRSKTEEGTDREISARGGGRILGISETHCSETDFLPKINGFNWSHNPGTERSAGAGILYRKGLAIEETKEFTQGRIAGIVIESQVIIEAYSPKEGDEKALDAFYEGLNEACEWGRARGKYLLLFGDFNAHIRGWWSDQTNGNGHLFKQLCDEWGLEILPMNKPTHLHSSGSTFCLEYCAIDRHILGKVISYEDIQNNPIKSDHLPVLLKIWEGWWETNRQTKKMLRLDRLQSSTYLKLYQEDVKRDLQDLDMNGDVGQIYREINKIVLGSAERVLGVKDGQRSVLGRDSLLLLREARRFRWKALKALKKDAGKYDELMRKHRLKMKEFKRERSRIEALTKREQEIENAIIGEKDMWVLYNRIKRLKRTEIIKLSGKEEEEMVAWWQAQYSDLVVETDLPNADPILPTWEEVNWAISTLGNKKATGPDGVPAELIKEGEEIMKEIYWRLIRRIWKERYLPVEMKEALVVLIPKKKGTKTPEDYRPITLLNTVYKILDKIIATRLAQEINTKMIMHTSQAGFITNRATSDQIHKLGTIIEYCLLKKRKIRCAFLDISKAFGSIRHNNLYETMKQRGISTDNIRMLIAMYKEAESRIIMDEHLTRSISIKKGVRQGGSSSPVCFNFIPNELAWKIDEMNIGVTVDEDRQLKLGLLLYADDIVLLAHKKKELQALCDICDQWAKYYSLKINQSKSVVVDYSSRAGDLHIGVNGQRLKQEKQFKYLGKIIARGKHNKADSKKTTEKTKAACRSTKAMLTMMKNIKATKKAIIARACIDPTALYAKECSQQNWDDIAMKVAENERMGVARAILVAPRGTARETAGLDLGWISLKNQMRMRTLFFRKKMLEAEDQLTKVIMKINKHNALAWEKRCKVYMNNLGIEEYDNKQIKRTEAKQWKRILEEAVKRCNLKEMVQRLEAETYKTTDLYRWTFEGAKATYTPAYVRLNFNMHMAIGAMHSMRAGFNSSNSCAHKRHLTKTHCVIIARWWKLRSTC